ncbi:GDSL-type esterase/lipase family protein [Streptomyces olivochromogenes]|uniref:GDSL-type esterase/lipase family protein n=1 Tax=Streptomyces olivochromogenes TaxID=1963 RepID=UPI001F20C631|nr:GDSL-type esterase/lipase family protein [Streptomyces olivochromogenes]MCF3131526.1 hypothetical protein [Streptomyces olivochromogenes]
MARRMTTMTTERHRRRLRRTLHRWLVVLLAVVTLGAGQVLLPSVAGAADIPTQDEVRTALASRPGSNIFWTGRVGACESEDDSVKPLAEKFAKWRGQKTLEMRLAEAGVKMPPFDTPDNNAKEIWRFASAEYARQTSGEAWVFKGKCVRDDNTWETRELPELKKSGKVKCIWEVDPDHEAYEKLIWNAWWWGSTCNGPVHLRNKAAQACVAFDEQNLEEGFKWRHFDEKDVNSWSYFYGWACIGGQPYPGTRDDDISPDAKGYSYSIDPDDSGPNNPSYIVGHTDNLIGWFRNSRDTRPYRLQLVDRSKWFARQPSEPYEDICTFENAVAFSAAEAQPRDQCGDAGTVPGGSGGATSQPEADKPDPGDDTGAVGADAASDQACNVMIVGDSISNGYEGDHTWRYRLWEWARDQQWKANFVGPLTGTRKSEEAHPPQPPPPVENGGEPATEDPGPAQFTGPYAASADPGFTQGGSAHYAMWGRRLGQDVDTIEPVMDQLKAQGRLPDVLLVELGFNDIGWQGAGAGLVDTMKNFVDNARKANPAVNIVLADVPQRTSLGNANPQLPQRTRDYDAALDQAVPQWSTATSPVVLADLDRRDELRPHRHHLRHRLRRTAPQPAR